MFASERWMSMYLASVCQLEKNPFFSWIDRENEIWMVYESIMRASDNALTGIIR